MVGRVVPVTEKIPTRRPKIVPEKDPHQKREDEDDDGGQWEKVVSGKGVSQEVLFQDKVKQLFPKDVEINEKNLLKKRQELLDGHCKTVRNSVSWCVLP